MLDIKYIVANQDQVRQSISARGVNTDLGGLLATYTEYKALQTRIEIKQAEANKLAKNMARLNKEQHGTNIAQGRLLNKEIASLQKELLLLSNRYQEALLTIPNLLAEDTPLGSSDRENLIIKTYLEPPNFTFAPKNHLELGNTLSLIDFESGAKVTGAKFYFLKNDAVFLELALKFFVFKVAMNFGYLPLITPDLAKKEILLGAGYSPRGEEANIYNIEDLDLSLIATAEIPICGIHANEILAYDQLPIKYVAASHCFRREAGASGRESRGLYRVHQFSKVELFQITSPEDSEAALAEILAIEEHIYQQLELPYRVVRICAGDLGAAAFKKYDLEVWMPGKEAEDKYGEVTSASNCTDFQARRLQIKYINAAGKKSYPYTLNGTAIALSRTLMAILENYQQADGRIIVPKVLRPYVDKEIIGKP